jgi:hypothetical protein
MVALVTADSGNEQEQNAGGKKKTKHTAIARPREINAYWREGARKFDNLPMAPPSTQAGHDQPDNQKSRRNEVGQNSDIGIRHMSHQLEQEQ